MRRPGRVDGCGGGAMAWPLREGPGCDGGRLLANCDEEREHPRRRWPLAPGWRWAMRGAPPLLWSYVLGKTVFDSFRTRTSGSTGAQLIGARTVRGIREEGNQQTLATGRVCGTEPGVVPEQLTHSVPQRPVRRSITVRSIRTGFRRRRGVRLQARQVLLYPRLAPWPRGEPR